LGYVRAPCPFSLFVSSDGASLPEELAIPARPRLGYGGASRLTDHDGGPTARLEVCPGGEGIWGASDHGRRRSDARRRVARDAPRRVGRWATRTSAGLVTAGAFGGRVVPGKKERELLEPGAPARNCCRRRNEGPRLPVGGAPRPRALAGPETRNAAGAAGAGVSGATASFVELQRPFEARRRSPPTRFCASWPRRSAVENPRDRAMSMPTIRAGTAFAGRPSSPVKNRTSLDGCEGRAAGQTVESFPAAAGRAHGNSFPHDRDAVSNAPVSSPRRLEFDLNEGPRLPLSGTSRRTGEACDRAAGGCV